MSETADYRISRKDWKPGAWCGYVGLSRGHKWHGVDYDDVPVEVHGGLTYAHRCTGDICHVPQAGESDDIWWLGFDTAHGGDSIPLHHSLLPRSLIFDETYRTMAYVEAEVCSLADQLLKGEHDEE